MVKTKTTTRIHSRFKCHLESINCTYYLHVKLHRSKTCKTGCGCNTCPFMDIVRDALFCGRIRRKRGLIECLE